MRGTVGTWVNSQWKYQATPGQFSVAINNGSFFSDELGECRPRRAVRLIHGRAKRRCRFTRRIVAFRCLAEERQAVFTLPVHENWQHTGHSRLQACGRLVAENLSHGSVRSTKQS